MQVLYGHILMSVIIHSCFVYALVMLHNSLEMIKVDQNMSEL